MIQLIFVLTHYDGDGNCPFYLLHTKATGVLFTELHRMNRTVEEEGWGRSVRQLFESFRLIWRVCGGKTLDSKTLWVLELNPVV